MILFQRNKTKRNDNIIEQEAKETAGNSFIPATDYCL